MGENGKRAGIGIGGLGMMFVSLWVLAAYANAQSVPIATTIAHGGMLHQAMPDAAKQ